VKPYYEDEKAGIVIYHGDCRKVLPALEFDVVVTDPPYGMAYPAGGGGAHDGEAVRFDEDAALRDAVLGLCSAKPALVMGRWSVARPDDTRMVPTWEKGNHVGMGDLSLPWKPNTEEIYVLGSGFVGHRGSSVLRALAIAGCVGNRNTGQRRHVTEKPVELMSQLLVKCPAAWTILDPFMGSGTTLRAAKDLGRHAIGIEIEERYCEIAARRLAQEVLL